MPQRCEHTLGPSPKERTSMRAEHYPAPGTDSDLGCNDGMQTELFGSTEPPFATVAPAGGASMADAQDSAAPRNVAQQSGTKAQRAAWSSSLVALAMNEGDAFGEQFASQMADGGCNSAFASRRHARAVLLRDPCAYCCADAEVIDHIVPKCDGGPDHWSNFAGLCEWCNATKLSATVLAFLLALPTFK